MNKQEFLYKYPQYLDMRLDELARNLHAKYYPDMPFDEFAAEFGVPEARPEFEDIAPHGRFFKEEPTPSRYGLVVEGVAPDIQTYVEEMAQTGAKRPGAGRGVDHPVSTEYTTAPPATSTDGVGRPIPGTGSNFEDADGKSWYSYKDRDKGWQAVDADNIELIEKIENYTPTEKNQTLRPLAKIDGSEWANVIGVNVSDSEKDGRAILEILGHAINTYGGIEYLLSDLAPREMDYSGLASAQGGFYDARVPEDLNKAPVISKAGNWLIDKARTGMDPGSPEEIEHRVRSKYLARMLKALPIPLVRGFKKIPFAAPYISSPARPLREYNKLRSEGVSPEEAWAAATEKPLVDF